MAAKNTDTNVVKDLWFSSTVYTDTSVVNDLWCSNTVWLLKTQIRT